MMEYKKILKDIGEQMQEYDKTEAKRLAILEKEARELQARQEYYEACLERARKEIAPSSIPEDRDGLFYEALKDEYSLHSKLLHLKEDGHIPDRIGDYIVEWILYEIGVFILIFVPTIALWLRGAFSIVLTLLLLSLWFVLSCYFAYLTFTPSVKKRLRVAAECKAACEILECRSNGNICRPDDIVLP